MDFSTNIKFSTNLIKGSDVEITYSGWLYQNNSDSITMVCGFGDNWNNTQELPMQKTESGFKVQIKMDDSNKFNFCFRNSNYEWDNNNYQNYISTIAEPEIEESFILNENIVVEILDNLFEKIFDNEKENVAEQTPIVQASTQENENSVVELVETGVVTEEPIELDLESTEAISIEETIGDITEETELDADLENVFTELYEAPVEETKRDEIVNFDMNSLVDEILSPIVESKSFGTENQKSIQEVTQTSSDEIEEIIVSTAHIEEKIENLFDKLEAELGNSSETNALVKVESKDSFLVSPRSLGKFYMFKKKVKLAIYKLVTAIPKIISAALDEEK